MRKDRYGGAPELRRKIVAGALPCAACLAVAMAVAAEPAVHVHQVSTTADHGPGSLRQALENAARTPGPDRIEFGPADGPFGTPQTIRLQAPLPVVAGEVTIDGFIDGLLWRAYGVTVSGAGRFRVLETAPGARLHLRGITVADGAAARGAGLLNRGRTVVEGVAFLRNRATGAGGAVANAGGELAIINSTAGENRAKRGGALANLAGSLRVVNSTLYANHARRGTAIFSKGPLALANSILAGEAGLACLNRGTLDASSTHNLIVGQRGCGRPISEADPRLQPIGYYNGPTPVFPLAGGSPALNLGENSAAVDAGGRPLVWDQRGNGDPRFAAGYTDLGAFEQQAPLASEFVVDSVEDNGLRGCGLVGPPDCPLRAALELAAAAKRTVPIRFDAGTFAAPTILRLPVLPVDPALPLVLDGAGAAPVTILVPTAGTAWQARNGVRLEVAVHALDAGGVP